MRQFSVDWANFYPGLYSLNVLLPLVRPTSCLKKVDISGEAFPKFKRAIQEVEIGWISYCYHSHKTKSIDGWSYILLNVNQLIAVKFRF